MTKLEEFQEDLAHLAEQYGYHILHTNEYNQLEYLSVLIHTRTKIESDEKK